MTPQSPAPVDVIRSFTDAVARKDYDSALTCLAEDCEYTNLPIGTVNGPAAVRGALEPFFSQTLENELVFLRTGVDGARVFTERLDRHRLEDRWVELPVMGLWEVEDGKIKVWREYFDLETLFRQWPEMRPA